jgi:hypothetical protein
MKKRSGTKQNAADLRIFRYATEIRNGFAAKAQTPPDGSHLQTECAMLTLLCLLLLYFVPTILARHKTDALGIFLVNLFLGWTVIGWVVALVWACAAEDVVRVRYVPYNYAAAGYGPVSGGRFCSRCGTLAPLASRYCSSCGHAF